ncbi:MAG: chromosome segregation protein SMC [Gemmatimonadetes bacterium]|nr:chromosome segregation protein SMC [Gemmatimonadota bacterium]
MKLTRLQLSGFKSFADTVELVIEDGVTAVVGPNGCGKSNISDAVRWVLGEQRARLLRGARMEDIIFQGSAKRRPINIADVSLYFDNSEGALPVPYGEVVVTRRLSRSGQSEYLLNQQPVRLRDVQDLLRGTGMGSDVGVVIEAQAIERLLSDRTEERRSLFEEAAGIGLYRDRKSGTERRLEQTAEDLQRLQDVIGEVQTQVRSLARQRGRAERHRKLTDERFAVVMTLARRELAECDEREVRLREHRSRLLAELPRAQELLRARERQRETRVQERATAEIRRTEAERGLASTRVDVERLEGDLNLSVERLGNAVARRARAREERSQAEARGTQAERERDAAAAERRAAEAARQSVQIELDLRSASEGEARGQLTAKREEVRELESSLRRLAETMTALDVEGGAIDREITQLRSVTERAERRRNELDGELRAAREVVDTARSILADREREEHESTAELERSRHALAAAREHEAALRIERRAAEEPLASLVARRGALEELERERVGLAPAARQLLGARERFGDGIIGPLSDYVRVSQGGAEVVERLLGEWLNAVLVSDDATVARIQQWHREMQPGPLVLLPVAPGPSPPLSPFASLRAGSLLDGRGEPAGSEQVSRPDMTFLQPAEAWLEALLGNQHLLTGGGIRRANGAVFLAGTESAAGPLSRRAELDRITSDIAAAEARLNELERRTSEAVTAHAQAEHTLSAAEIHAELARRGHRETLGAFDDALRTMQRLERERTEADDNLSRAVRTREERAARAQRIDVEQAAMRREREERETGLVTLRAALADLEAAQEAARERRVHWQVEEAQVSAREQGAREREQRAEQILSQAEQDIRALDEEMAGLDRDLAELERARSQWADQLAERKVAAQQLEAAAATANASVLAAEEALSETERLLDEARAALHAQGEESHGLELQEAEAGAQRRVLLERIEAEWQKPATELLRAAPDLEGDPAQLREEAERLAREIEAIGPVNPLAVEEHAEEVKRAEFLINQRDDLVAARNALEQAVREIDQTARGMFLETFNSVRSNFHTVFRTLFEGGECDVRLADENDPLGSDIEIHAAPRGKRTQRIHLLSSGERALVAISLLFSIYLTKPSPFCVLDEVDAPLDDANVIRFVRLLDEFKSDTQFIVITHNPRTMQVADAVYGVTMQEPGVSSIVGVRLGEVETV